MHPFGGRYLPVPEGSEDLKHVGARNLADRHLADAGEGEPPQARYPFLGVYGAAPSGPLLLQHTHGSFGEGRDAFGTALLGERVPTLAGELAVGEGLLPGFGQGNEDNAAESELTAATSDEKALNPASGTAGLDEEVQSVSIGVSTGRSGANEGRREGLLGMAVDCKGCFGLAEGLRKSSKILN